MVENVKIACVRDLPVSLTHLLRRSSSSLPSSLSSAGLGRVVQALRRFSSKQMQGAGRLHSITSNNMTSNNLNNNKTDDRSPV